jgi:hypothetical protein
VVRHYREARAVHDAHGNVDTEQQRTAVTSYRSLIDALLGNGDDHAGHDHADHADHDHTDHRVDDRTDDRTDRPVDGDHTDPAQHLDHGSRNGSRHADVTTTTEEQTR